MIDYAYESLFKQNSVFKNYAIAVYENEALEQVIRNDDLYSQELELSTPLCSEESLKYGSCEASSIKFKVNANVGTLKNKKLIVYVQPKSAVDMLQIGVFYVYSDKISSDRKSREIEAYDSLFMVLNYDLDEWYLTIPLPLTLRDFRNAFFEFFNIAQEQVTLVNDEMVITRSILPDKLSGKDVITAICEANGCFGKIDNTGMFRYIYLNDTDTVAYTTYKQGTLQYEDYLVQPITALKVYSNNDMEIDIGSGTNMYVIEDNFLFYDKLVSDVMPYLQNIYDIITDTPPYRPLKFSTYGDPCVEAGDKITVTTPSGDTYVAFVLERKLTGFQALTDKFESNGTEYYEYDINSNSSQIRRIWNNTLVLQTQVENARCYVYAHRNTVAYTVSSSEPTQIISITLAATDNTIPVFMATIPLVMSLDGEVTFRYFLDGVEIDREDNDTIYLTKGEQFVTISTFFEMMKNTRKTFSVTAQTAYRQSVEREQTAKIISLKDWIDNQTITVDVQDETATFNYDYVEHPIDTTPPGATIGMGKIRAIIFASGLASEQPWDGNIEIAEDAEFWTISDIPFASAVEALTFDAAAPLNETLADVVSEWAISNIAFTSLTDAVSVTTKINSYRRVLEDGSVRITEDNNTRYTEGD